MTRASFRAIQIEGITVSFDNGANIMNFAEAALVIQGSACVYSKKVGQYCNLSIYSILYFIGGVPVQAGLSNPQHDQQ